MATISTLRPPATSAPATLAELASSAAARHIGPALRFHAGGDWRDLSYARLRDRAAELAKGLIAAGVQPGDRVAIFGATCPEWTVCDLAALQAGAVVVPIYHTSSEEEVAYLLEHSGTVLALCEDAELAAKVERADVASVRNILRFDALDALAETGREVTDEALTAATAAVSPDDPCTIVYTSGTTGRPKGCVLTHANVTANMAMLDAAVRIEPGSRVFAFLPLAHVLTRMTQFATITGGGTIAYWRGRPEAVLEDLAEIRPTHLPSVPRVFQKIHAKATGGSGLKADLLQRAVAVGREVRWLERRGLKPGGLLALRHRLLDRLVLSKVRGVFGGEVRFALSGGAPISAEVLEFFDACGLEVLEGWGMTECSAACTINPIGGARYGTVGRALPGCRLMIADDGEILVAGPHVFGGYYLDEEATRETFNEDGWLRTGDLGSIDADGYLRITGRKKELLITSSGKNISPVAVEHALTNAPIISQAVVAGEGRPYLVALLALDPEESARLSGGAEDPRTHPAVREAVESAVAAANDRLARIEQIKRYEVLDRELTVDDGELTPTLKVKRKVVTGRHAEQIAALYETGQEPA